MFFVFKKLYRLTKGKSILKLVTFEARNYLEYMGSTDLNDLRPFKSTSLLDALLRCNLKLFKRFVASLNALHRVDIPSRYLSVSPCTYIRP